ncbi:hypothetical protein I5E68_08950 [Novosphingobium sp. YJ-S2-02]|uniref:Uncharacterized protein n=1 Tax=Novosphingobium aureum TaxID=2792964 RepID=A0A931HCQ4_9SPHN|nr:hypothetical protein [Novosphingobium aureum]MBH0113073.1 hypothetical protein [Novosphingobium aureum]
MTRYRYVTPHKTGKWYPDLATAQRFACAIGAGFLDRRSGRFVAYIGTVLQRMQVREPGQA